MTYTEKKMDLFSAPSDYMLAHCISADFALGAGIAVEINNRYNVREELNAYFSNLKYSNDIVGTCIDTGIVYNLITKMRYYEKPTYDTLKSALISLRNRMQSNGHAKIAMPLIGCGLDKLKWIKVKETILEVFEQTDIEILVCKL